MPTRWHSANLDGRRRPLPDAAFCRASGFAEGLTLGKKGLCRVSGLLGKAFFVECPTFSSRRRKLHSAMALFPVSTVEDDDEEGSRKAQVRLRSYRFSCRHQCLPLQRTNNEENAGSFLPAQNLNPVAWKNRGDLHCALIALSSMSHESRAQNFKLDTLSDH